MAVSDDRPLGLLLTDTEVEELRALAREHLGAELSFGEAQSAARQLLQVLATVRDVALRGSSASASSVDYEVLPDSEIGAISTLPPT